MNKIVTTQSFAETQKFGKDFLKQLHDAHVLALHGDLGSGKTTFVQGLAQGLGITQRIISPTFIIMRTYQAHASGFKHFYHVDLYRIKSERDIEGLGLLEIMQDPENLVVIEWPEKIENLLPDKRVDLFFEYIADDERKITMK